MEEFEQIQKEKNKICENTYIQKQQFIEMLQNLNFVAIEKASIDFITMYQIDVEKDEIKPKGFRIELY